MHVRHATLHNVIGRPARQAGWTIVPAEVELAGSSFSPSFPLAELPPDRIPPVLRRPVASGYDAAWVRARLPHAFGISPEAPDIEKTLLLAGFVAVAEGQSEALAFECSDYYGRTSLMFSDDETDETAKAQVAQAFWDILLAEPDELEDFEARVLHLGAPVSLCFGCKHGEPYCDEEED